LLVLLCLLLQGSSLKQSCSKTPGTITQRKRKDGSTANTVQIRTVKKGETVYQETQTLDRMQRPQAWISKREAKLYEPRGIEKASWAGVTIKETSERHLNHEKLRWAIPSGLLSTPSR